MENALVERSVSTVMKNKMLDYLERHTVGEMGSHVLKVSGACLVALSVCDVQEAVRISGIVLTWADYSVPKASVAFAMSWYSDRWVPWVFAAIRNAWTSEFLAVGRRDIPCVYGIPVAELVAHLFDGDGSFRREDAERLYAIPRNRFDAMARELDAVGMFVRGENNCRRVNPSWSRSDAVAVLMAAAESGEIRPLRREVAPNTWTHSPSLAPDASGFVRSEVPRDR